MSLIKIAEDIIGEIKKSIPPLWHTPEKKEKERLTTAIKGYIREAGIKVPKETPKERKEIIKKGREAQAELGKKLYVDDWGTATDMLTFFGTGVGTVKITEKLLSKATTPKHLKVYFDNLHPAVKKIINRINLRSMLANFTGWATAGATVETYSSLRKGENFDSALNKGIETGTFSGTIGAILPLLGIYVGAVFNVAKEPFKVLKTPLKKAYSALPESIREKVTVQKAKWFPLLPEETKHEFIENKSFAGMAQMTANDEIKKANVNLIRDAFERHKIEIAEKGKVPLEQIEKFDDGSKLWALMHYAPEEVEKILPVTYQYFKAHEAKYKQLNDKLKSAFENDVLNTTKEQIRKTINGITKTIKEALQSAEKTKEAYRLAPVISEAEKDTINYSIQQLWKLQAGVKKIKSAEEFPLLGKAIDELQTRAKEIERFKIKLNIDKQLDRIQKVFLKQLSKVERFKEPSAGYLTFAREPLKALEERLKTPLQHIYERNLQTKIIPEVEISSQVANTIDFRNSLFLFEKVKEHFANKAFSVERFKHLFTDIPNLYEILEKQNYTFPMLIRSSVAEIRRLQDAFSKAGMNKKDAMFSALSVYRRLYSTAEELSNKEISTIEKELVSVLENPERLKTSELYGIVEIDSFGNPVVDWKELENLINANAGYFTDVRYLKPLRYSIDTIINPDAIFKYEADMTGKSLLGWNFLMKYGLLAFAPFHARALLVSKAFSNADLFSIMPDYVKIVSLAKKPLENFRKQASEYFLSAQKIAQKHGITLPITFNFPKDYITAEKILSTILGMSREKARKIVPYFYEYRIFEALYPYLKAKDTFTILKGLDKGIFTKQEAMRKLLDINTVYGGIPELLLMHPKINYALRMAILAPDWQLSLIKQFMGPVFGDTEHWLRYWSSMLAWNFLITINWDRLQHPEKSTSELISDFFGRINDYQKHPFTSMFTISNVPVVFDFLGFEAEAPQLFHHLYRAFEDAFKGEDIFTSLYKNMGEIFYNRSSAILKNIFNLYRTISPMEKQKPSALEFAPVPFVVSTFNRLYHTAEGTPADKLFASTIGALVSSGALARVKALELKHIPFQSFLHNSIDHKMDYNYFDLVRREARFSRKTISQVLAGHKASAEEFIYQRLPEKNIIIDEIIDRYGEDSEFLYQIDSYLFEKLELYIKDYEKKYNEYRQLCRENDIKYLPLGLPAPAELRRGLIGRFKRDTSMDKKEAIEKYIFHEKEEEEKEYEEEE